MAVVLLFMYEKNDWHCRSDGSDRVGGHTETDTIIQSGGHLKPCRGRFKACPLLAGDHTSHVDAAPTTQAVEDGRLAFALPLLVCRSGLARAYLYHDL